MTNNTVQRTKKCGSHGPETRLICNRCNKNRLCINCAIYVKGVGYQCAECVYKHKQKYGEPDAIDKITVTFIIGFLSIFIGLAVTGISLLTAEIMPIFLVILVAVPARKIGQFISDASVRLVKQRRNRYLPLPKLVTFCVVVGGLIPFLMVMIFTGSILFIPLFYAFFAAQAAYIQLH